jgi:dihydropyrimidinase
LSLLYTYGVKTGKITITQFVNLVSTRPAEIFGLGDRKGKLLPGYDADIVIWDPDYKGTISVANHVQKCDAEIYEGFPVTGRAETVILRGKIVQ